MHDNINRTITWVWAGVLAGIDTINQNILLGIAYSEEKVCVYKDILWHINQNGGGVYLRYEGRLEEKRESNADNKG